MAFTASNTSTFGFNVSARLHAFVETLKLAKERRAIERRTFRELAGLTDRELADIGINRSMIKDLARQEAAKYF